MHNAILAANTIERFKGRLTAKAKGEIESQATKLIQQISTL
jgi:hypothetical protein